LSQKGDNKVDLSLDEKKELLIKLLRNKISGETDIFPLSHGQKALWYLHQLTVDTGTYNMMFAWRIISPLNIEILHHACQVLINRHAVLRTTYPTYNGEPVQRVHKNFKTHFEKHDVSEYTEKELNQKIAYDAYRPFSLQHESVMRVYLYSKGPEEHILLLVIHHIAVDSVSIIIIVEELLAIYQAETNGRKLDLPRLQTEFVDYVRWESKLLASARGEKIRSYWQEELTGELPVLKWPCEHLRPPIPTFRGASQNFTIGLQLTDRLKSLAKAESVTLYILLLTAFKLLLYRYTGQNDILIGTPAIGRIHPAFKRVVGYLANPLVLRTKITKDQTFRSLLSCVRQTVLNAIEHQDYPFPLLVRNLQSERDPRRSPIFSVVFNLLQSLHPDKLDQLGGKELSIESLLMGTSSDSQEIAGLAFEYFPLEQRVSRFDMTLLFVETDKGLSGYLQYSTDLFDSTTINFLSTSFINLLNIIVAQPNIPLNKLDLVKIMQETLSKNNHQEIKMNKLKHTKRKAVDLSQISLIKTSCLGSTLTSARIIEPVLNDVNPIDVITCSLDLIKRELLIYGAVIFRGFKIETIEAFEQFAMSICPTLYGEYGDLPREEIKSKVYNSTPYPSNKAILFHNESSHLHQWPMKIWFFCIKAAEQGGETPIVDCRKVLQKIPLKIRETFQKKGLMYVRNYSKGLDVSWQDFFRTTDKSVVEQHCQKSLIRCEWKNSDELRISQIRPAITAHPYTGEEIFFNQIQLYHFSCLDEEIKESLKHVFNEEDFPRNVYYGDGTPIDDEVVKEIQEIYQQISFSFPWQEGDILMLDNMLMAHGRNPFIGKRKIVVALGEMMSS
jgi:alpha-ketoglutarate-dependent taurine dioxygenase